MRFLQFIARLFRPVSKKSRNGFNKTTSLEHAIQLKHHGDLHGTIAALQRHLEEEPYDVAAITIMGVCQADLGRMDAARSAFELAYSLDDTGIPELANYARMLVDDRKSQDALPILRQAKIRDPGCLFIDAIYAAMVRNNGDAEAAVPYYLRAWLANFDSLRFANGFLFNSAYCEADGAQLAAEHRFWAETSVSVVSLAIPHADQLADRSRAKNRIGYWSPDFREHSIRYFLRPLLENHDRDQVEIFLYYDYPKEDAQTALIRSACDYFHPVCDLNDTDLLALVHSHQLDVFVELAGHSSYNRALLLQQRFATIQVSALGYPPTMGLASIDAKILDRHVITDESSRCYAEAPLVLPTSFWCFDPMTIAPIDPEPPSVRNDYLTFACVGNVAKITDDVLRCWKSILERVQNSRLLIRSISFEDAASEDMVRDRLAAAGIALRAVDLCKPKRGEDFFSSYNEIDVVLDTFPFNGGTTTCFATYMGVPVVSWAGNSLISRMGLSILTNLGVPELVVHDAKAYTECAVGLASNLVFLRQFRLEARERFLRTALGNGKLFAQEFEEACRELLAQKQDGTFSYQHTIPPLPADEIVRRAYTVLSYGQTEAAERIVGHCLRHYPNSGSAHLLVTQLWTTENRFATAVEYLLARLNSFSESEQVSIMIYVTRLHLLLEQKDEAEKMIERLAGMQIADQFDRMQVNLYRASITAATETETAIDQSIHDAAKARRFRVLIPCNNVERFESMCEQIRINCHLPQGCDVSYQRCNEDVKIAAYQTALRFSGTDVLIFIQKNVALHNPMFLVEVSTALESCDMLGFAGATRWSRMEWRADDFERKAAGFMVESSENTGFTELQLLGVGVESVMKDIAILDGSLLALVPGRLCDVTFDEDLPGAGLLLEEDWSHCAFKSGFRLAVHRNLGVKLDREAQLDDSNRAVGRVRCSEKMGWDTFAIVKDDNLTLTLAVDSPARAVLISQTYMRGSCEVPR
jgi:protein O-GlcNAc transferase